MRENLTDKWERQKEGEDEKQWDENEKDNSHC